MTSAQKPVQRVGPGRFPGGGVSAVALLLCLVVLAPFAALAALAMGSSGPIWGHLATTVLPSSTLTTALLMTGVGLLTSVIGVGTAWLVSRYRFFGRGVLQWALVLPLAVPTYISAYCFVELLDFTGPVQQAVRSLGGYRTPSDYWFPDVRSLPGAIFIMAVVLYPYVYLTCRIVFEMQAANTLDMGRVLGAGPWRLFLGIALPMARPAIVAGATLAMLEALNDIGAVEMLGVRTLTFAVFDTWLNRSSLAGAAQIACLMLVIVTIVIYAERRLRGSRRYVAGDHGAGYSLVRPGRPASIAIALCCFLPFAAGFLTPALLLAAFALRRTEQIFDPQLAQAAINSVMVSLSAALVTVLVSMTLIVTARRGGNWWTSISTRFAMLGYAVPGSVLAIGTLYAFTAVDNGIDDFFRRYFGYSTGLILSGSAAIVIYGCSVRFLAIANGAIESGYSRISGHLAMVARTLGRSENQALFAVEVPLLRRAFATAGLLVFVDTMKELSATVLLRPFNFSTLATFVYERASRARFEDGAIAAFVIVAIGTVPMLLLNRIQTPGLRGEGR